MILVDANVFMYAAGAPHPNKRPAVAFLQRAARGEIAAAVDAEVLQEILHRYRAIHRWDDGKTVYDLARQVVAGVLPVGVEVLDRTRALMDRYPHLMARDALHTAVCHHHGADGICSYDRDFDQIADITRYEPADLLS